MPLRRPLLVLVLLGALPLLGCKQNAPAAGAPAADRPAPPSLPTPGRVIEVLHAGDYTYVYVDQGARQRWAAGPKTTVEAGDTVLVEAGSPRKDFTSPTLGRTFDSITFVNRIEVVREPARPAAAPLQVPEGGTTVEGVIRDRMALAGKPVALRARATKINSGILKHTWIHLEDGTGGPGTNDLVVTTSLDCKAVVGDTVLVKGTVTVDKDFGAGYRYAVLLEDAQVTVE